MNKCCANCKYARLIFNKKYQKEFVGCVQYQSFDVEHLLEELKINNYKSYYNFIMTGWVYNKIPFGKEEIEYGAFDTGVLTNGCLISPKEAVCDKFKEKDKI